MIKEQTQISDLIKQYGPGLIFPFKMLLRDNKRLKSLSDSYLQDIIDQREMIIQIRERLNILEMEKKNGSKEKN